MRRRPFFVRRVGHEHGPPCAGSSHGNQAILVRRMLWVGRDARIVREQGFNLRERNSMLSALRPVAVIPIETADLKVYHSMILDKCIYIFALPFSSSFAPPIELFRGDSQTTTIFGLCALLSSCVLSWLWSAAALLLLHPLPRKRKAKNAKERLSFGAQIKRSKKQRSFRKPCGFLLVAREGSALRDLATGGA